MVSVLSRVLQDPILVVYAAIPALIVSALGYVVYQRYFHPLASYPGPFWASITDLWQVSQFLGLKQPYNLTELHERHGPFVRYGPDKLSVTAEEIVPLVYQKGGRMMPKTEFYDAYGAAIPNVFGMRDEAVSCFLLSIITTVQCAHDSVLSRHTRLDAV
jgi:hypothetical protein